MGSFALKGYFFAGCSHESCDNCIVLGGVDNIVTEDRKFIVGKDKIHCFVLAENRYNALIKWLDLKLRQVGKLELAFLHCAVSTFHSFSAKTQSVYKAHHFKVGKESLCFLGIDLAQLIKLCSFINRGFKTYFGKETAVYSVLMTIFKLCTHRRGKLDICKVFIKGLDIALLLDKGKGGLFANALYA